MKDDTMRLAKTNAWGASLAMSRLRFLAGREALLLVTIMILVAIISSVTEGAFWGAVNLNNLMVDTAITLIPAIGMTVVVLTGGIDVSVGSIAGLSAAVGGTCFAAGWGLAETIPVFLATGLVLGLVNAGLIVYGRIPPIVATLAALSVYRMGVFTVLSGDWITMIPPRLTTIFVLNRVLFMPTVAIIAVVLLIAAAVFLRYFRWGRQIYALGNNEEAAWLAGIRPERIKLCAYVLVGLLTGFAALMMLAESPMAQTSTGEGFELQVIAAVLLGGTALTGGRGTMLGTLLGTTLVRIIDDGIILLHIQPFWGGVALGAIILFAIGISVRNETGESS